MKQITIFAITLLFSVQMKAAIIHVSEAGAGLMDGTSWGNAFPGTSLQTAINSAAAGDEIWVACGTFYPTNTNNRSLSFSMRENISIYGGFLGNETQLAERNLSCESCSVLSGDIGVQGQDFDNSYKVVYNAGLSDPSILDGFVIRDGNDDRSPTHFGDGLGGGVYNHGAGLNGICNPTIRNCLFTNNSASWGAGAFNNAYQNGTAVPTYFNCIFYQNHAYIEAGGMDTYANNGGFGNPSLYNCVFYENTSATNVGAMYAWGGGPGSSCSVTLVNCIFANNSALNGYGGAFIADSQDPNGGGTTGGQCQVNLQNTVVWNNQATGAGPQFYVRGGNSAVFATYSDIDMTGQGAPHVLSGAGTGNLTTNPFFQDITNGPGPDLCWFSLDDGLQIQLYSPLLNRGDAFGTTDTDVLDNPRQYGGHVDIGSYELQRVSPRCCSEDVNRDAVVDDLDAALVQGMLGQSCNCLEDVDGNGDVELNDYNQVVAAIGEPFNHCLVDVNCDGGIDSLDVLHVQGRLGEVCNCREDVDLDGVVTPTDVLLVTASIGQPCYPEDFNADGAINVTDFLSLVGVYGSPCPGCPQDLSGDGVVDVVDFLQFLATFGVTTCP